MKEIKDLEVVVSKEVSKVSATKEVYLVVVEDPTSKTKSRMYLTSRINEKAFSISLTGYEITNKNVVQTQKDEPRNFNEVMENAKNNASSGLELVTIPWQRVINYKTINCVVNTK